MLLPWDIEVYTLKQWPGKWQTKFSVLLIYFLLLLCYCNVQSPTSLIQDLTQSPSCEETPGRSACGWTQTSISRTWPAAFRVAPKTRMRLSTSSWDANPRRTISRFGLHAKAHRSTLSVFEYFISRPWALVPPPPPPQSDVLLVLHSPGYCSYKVGARAALRSPLTQGPPSDPNERQFSLDIHVIGTSTSLSPSGIPLW